MDQPANPEARNPSLSYQTGCLIVVDTFRAHQNSTKREKTGAKAGFSFRYRLDL
jgi:hypothetical protein